MQDQVLILGQGCIGSFLGSSLAYAGIPVHHFVRSPHPKREIELQFRDSRARSFRIPKGTSYKYQFWEMKEDGKDARFLFFPLGQDQWKEALLTWMPLVQPNQTMVLSGNLWWEDLEWIEENCKHPYVFAFPNFGGAIVEGTLRGWLNSRWTLGVAKPQFQENLKEIEGLLLQVGFRPTLEEDIRGWLTTHFAYNAGMLLEAARLGGFQRLSKSFSGIVNMYKTMRECMEVAEALGVKVRNFPEGREVFSPYFWQALKMFLIFCLPGLAKSADANLDRDAWIGYGRKLWILAKKKKIPAPRLQEYFEP